MADDTLQSNIIIKTKVAKPNREGFRSIFKDLDDLNRKLVDLTSKNWTVKLQVDDSALKAYGLAKGGTPGGGGTPPPRGPGSTPPGYTGTPGSPYYRRTVQTPNSMNFTEKVRSRSGGTQTTESFTTGDNPKYVKEELDITEKQAQERKRRNTQRLKREQTELTRSLRDDERAGQQAEAAEESAFESRRRRNTQRLKREQAELTRNLTSEQRLEQREAAIESRQRRKLDKLDAGGHLREESQIRNTNTRRESREANEYVRTSTRARSRADLDRQFDSLVNGGGFTARDSTRQYNAKTGEFTELRQAIRTTGNAFTGYTVQVARANQATGRMTIETYRGSAAMRILGDSVLRAVAKVSLWSVATAAVFTAVAAIKNAATEVAKLEENSVLLARVGSKFAGGSAEFKDRYEAAKKLTSQLIELTQIYGGMATEAQKAAAIFARSGRDETETLHATRAALIASKIAELEVEEAAKLLSAAMLQFNLKGQQLLPTLDALNTLSNQYRVTTDDLLQAISRTGAVYADHNGRLTELAALTAVVSQVTARSGSEIGNAFKTISSNLDRVDTQQVILERLSVSTVNFEGDAKSLGQIIFELRNRFDSLSESQQKQLTLQIAGVRQRNALVAALKNVDEAIIAENNALLKGGSAVDEFKESSRTLVSALERLKATFIAVANEAGELAIPFVHGFLSMIDVLLRMLTIFNGWPAKIALATVAILALSRALVACGVATAIFSRQILLANVAIGATLLIIGALAQQYVEYNASLATNVDNINASIDAEHNKRTAIVNTANAIAQLIKKHQELKAAGKDAEAEDVKKRAQNIVNGSPGLGLGIGDFTLEGLARSQSGAQQASLQRERQALEKKASAQRDELQEATNARTTAFNRASRGGYTRSFSEIFGFEGATDPEHFGKKAAKQLDQAEANRVKAARELKDTEQKIADLKEQEIHDVAKQKEFEAALSAIYKDRLRDEDRLREKKTQGFRNTVDPKGEQGRAYSDYVKINNEAEKELATLNKILDIADKQGNAENYAEDIKRVNKLLDDQVEAYKKIVELQMQSAKSAVGGIFATRNKLAEGSALIGLEKERRLGNASTYGDKIAEIDIRRRVQSERIKNAQSAIEASKRDGGMSGAQQAGAINAAREEEQAAITELKDLEAEKALAILEAEKNIAIERKKSADEAARALGSLSSEDKLRVRAQAAYFAKNPGAKVSLEDQFNMDEKSGGILGQFFQSHQETLTDAKGKLADDLRKGGFGMTEDLVKGEKEVSEARRGRSDKEILDDARRRSTVLEKGLSDSQGGNIPLSGLGAFSRPFDVGGGVTKDGRIDTNIPVEIKTDTINFEPLIASFEKVAGVLMDEKVGHLAERIEEIANEQRALSGRGRPQRYGGNGSN